MQLIKKYFGFLEPKKLINMSEEEILNKCEHLTKKYAEVISPKFCDQFVHAISMTRNDLNEKMTIRKFAELLLTKYSCLESEFSELYSVFMLFLTLPVTVASVERSFSKLKIIKDYKRNSIGENRLKNLALLAIEHKEASKMDLKDLINKFANAKARKKMF